MKTVDGWVVDVLWTVAPRPVFDGVSNIAAELELPTYTDVLPDETLVVSELRKRASLPGRPGVAELATACRRA